MMQFIFFGVSVVVLVMGHALVWAILIKIFHLMFGVHQLAAALIISFLLISTLLSSYLIHKWDNLFTRLYYIFSGFWIGLMVNVVLVALAVFLIRHIAGLAGWQIPEIAGQIGLIIATLLLTGIGIYRAAVPQVVEYEVFIKDLPEAWNNKSIIHISDVHLGAIYRQRFFYKLIGRINELKPEAVFITGDLFDGMEADFSWLNHPLNLLEAPQGVYYGFGNHDLYLGFDKVINLLEHDKITILDNKMKVVDGLQIIGVDYSFENDFNLEQAILKQVGYSPASPSLLMFHAPKNIGLAKSAGIDLQLSGHTHDGQIWPFNYIAKWAHHGYGYGFFNEGDFNLVVSGGVGSWGPPMRTAARSEIVKITLRKK